MEKHKIHPYPYNKRSIKSEATVDTLKATLPETEKVLGNKQNQQKDAHPLMALELCGGQTHHSAVELTKQNERKNN